MSRLKKMRFDSSIRQVLNSDDILSEILLLLPPETIYKLILVSKRWLEIISNPLFRRSYLTKWKSRSELIGFFVIKTKNSGSFTYELRSSHSLPVPSRSSVEDGVVQLGYFNDSSNGFILCNPMFSEDYYLWYPSTRKRHQLPLPTVHLENCLTSLIIKDCPDKEFSYKVIRAERRCYAAAKLRVDIFSSKTETWSYSELTCPEPMSLWSKGRVIDGVVYWYANGDRVAIYDSNNKENRIDLIKLPKIYYSDEQVMGDSGDGCLQYGRSSKSVMEIWKLEKVNSMFQWKIQHKLNFKVLRSWNNVEAPRVKTVCYKEKQLLAFPTSSSATTTTTQRLKPLKKKKKKKKLSMKNEEEQEGFPCGISSMSCHSFDGLGLPFSLQYRRRSDVYKILGKKLLSHYFSSSVSKEVSRCESVCMLDL